MFDIPILFVIFKRKDIAVKTFESIKAIKPSKLYIACDGPRKHVDGEKEMVAETRVAIEQLIDWPCEVHKRYMDHNLGCSKGVSQAISWLFENEEMGIILEDDCLARQSFVPYCEELLHKYYSDERVGMIAGTNLISNKVNMPDSYCFSKYDACWGWATWKRAWSNFDLNMNWRNTEYSISVLANNGYRGKDIKYWKYRLKLIDQDYVSAWDWQWYFTLASQNQLCIFPNNCLIHNIGFDTLATHTSQFNAPKYKDIFRDITFPLSHPQYVLPFESFDKAFYRENNSLYMNIIKYIPLNIKTFFKKLR